MHVIVPDTHVISPDKHVGVAGSGNFCLTFLWRCCLPACLLLSEMGIGGWRCGGVEYPRLTRLYTQMSNFNERSILLLMRIPTQLVECLSI